ncbi:MAG TPA: hypothetical protein PL063_00030 [Candidatus Cloacimonadota bacterium]|jgi:hypothetical protein|nr:hypothetical protein [Candidatus Cloacimonadota bacterium]HQB40145.1 hypothetical protein [Candidatus Cloacimonadota bacterium]
MSNNNNKIAPTITLAQLYEAQQQYFDAYLTYKKIYDNNNDELIFEKMNTAERKIFEEPTLKYHHLVQGIFSANDLSLFKILPKELYENYQKSLADIIEEVEFIEEEFEENENDMTEAEEIELVYEPEGPIETIAEIPTKDISTPIFKESIDMFNINSIAKINKSPMSVADLCSFLTDFLGSDKRVSDISIAELFYIIDKVKK